MVNRKGIRNKQLMAAYVNDQMAYGAINKMKKNKRGVAMMSKRRLA